MPIIDISHTITDGMAGYPGDSAPRLVQTSTHTSGGNMSSRLELSCHTGTHIDTPLHFRSGQPGLAELSLETFCGQAIVLAASAADIPGPLGAGLLNGVDLATTDFVLLHTGWDRFWGSPRYYDSWPFLDLELARLLSAAGLKGVGLDSPSVDPHEGREVHDLFAASGYVNIENLTNLATLPGHSFTFMAMPLKLAGTEASPVRALALI